MSVPKSFVIDYELAQAPSTVWRVLTEPELLKQWLMENDIRPVVGHKFTFRAQPQPWWDGVVHCEILEVEPGSRLRYSWKGGALDATAVENRRDAIASRARRLLGQGPVRLQGHERGLGR